MQTLYTDLRVHVYRIFLLHLASFVEFCIEIFWGSWLEKFWAAENFPYAPT